MVFRSQNELKNLLENIDDTVSKYNIDYNLEILEKYYKPNSQEKLIDQFKLLKFNIEIFMITF